MTPDSPPTRRSENARKAEGRAVSQRRTENARKPAFRPRFSLGLVYFFAFFFLYCFVFALPALIEVATSVPPGPEQEEMAKQAAYEATRQRLPFALIAAVITVAVANYTRALPGMRGGS